VKISGAGADSDYLNPEEGKANSREISLRRKKISNKKVSVKENRVHERGKGLKGREEREAHELARSYSGDVLQKLYV